MKIEVSKYFSEQGYTAAYKIIDRNGRADVHLVKGGKRDAERKCISYAKYLWMSEHEEEIPEGYEVDHINEDFTDDRLDNLQILSKAENIQKAAKTRYNPMVTRVCPICGKEFEFPRRNLATHPNPCCSRSCGGRMSHITLAARKGPNP